MTVLPQDQVGLGTVLHKMRTSKKNAVSSAAQVAGYALFWFRYYCNEITTALQQINKTRGNDRNQCDFFFSFYNDFRNVVTPICCYSEVTRAANVLFEGRLFQRGTKSVPRPVTIRRRVALGSPKYQGLTPAGRSEEGDGEGGARRVPKKPIGPDELLRTGSGVQTRHDLVFCT